MVDDYEVPEIVVRYLPWTAVQVMMGSQETIDDCKLEDAFGVRNDALKEACHTYDRLRCNERPITRRSAVLSFNQVADENSVTEVSNCHA